MTDYCDHYIHESERKAGFTTCFKCDVTEIMGIVDLLEQKQRYEREIAKINHYIEVEWPNELQRHAANTRWHVEETGEEA